MRGSVHEEFSRKEVAVEVSGGYSLGREPVKRD